MSASIVNSAASQAPLRGRPPSTSRDHLAGIALALFVRNGFEETTLDDIASEVGVGRRTLFRYFSSKNDLVWGNFDGVLDRLRGELAAARSQRADDGDPRLARWWRPTPTRARRWRSCACG